MSDWIKVSGYMVVTDYLPCTIGKKYTIDDENDLSPSAELCGYTTSRIIGSILVSLRDRWAYQHDKSYNPFNFQDRILWKVPYLDCNGEYDRDEEDEEWITWDEYKIDDKTLILNALEFPCGSEGPLDLTVIPHVNEWGTSWHIVFNGSLRDRTNYYFDHLKDWWKAVQMLLNVDCGFIRATYGSIDKWEDVLCS